MTPSTRPACQLRARAAHWAPARATLAASSATGWLKVRTDEDWLELATDGGSTIRVLKAAHPRARRLRLTVTPRGARLSYPRGTHPAQVSAFLRTHADWLAQKFDELHLAHKPLAKLKLGQVTEFPLRGVPVTLAWAEGPYPRTVAGDGVLTLVLPRPHARALPVARGLIASYLEAQLRRDVARWLAGYVPQLGLAPTALKVRPMKSLWGSLDTRDRINLDLSLAMAPPAVLRYVLVHELCHLRVRSHAPKFWAWVESFLPDWREQRDWLRAHGSMLKAELERLVADVAD